MTVESRAKKLVPVNAIKPPPLPEAYAAVRSKAVVLLLLIHCLLLLQLFVGEFLVSQSS